MLDAKIKIRGGKNLKLLDLNSQEYLLKCLAIMRQKLLAAWAHGVTDTGESMPEISEDYAKYKEKEGKGASPNMELSGKLLAGLDMAVTSKATGKLYFSGIHSTNKTPKALIKRLEAILAAAEKAGDSKVAAKVERRLKVVREKGSVLRNQDVADRIASRRGGGRWDNPTSGKPVNEFMGIGTDTAREFEALYNAMVVEPRIKRLPPIVDTTI
jgi:hypothetical protein